MNELKNILEQNLNDNFISAVLSNPRDEKLSAKVKVRPVLMKDTRVYQMETFRGNQAFHENLSADEACEKMLEAMENMKQMQLVTADEERYAFADHELWTFERTYGGACDRWITCGVSKEGGIRRAGSGIY